MPPGVIGVIIGCGLWIQNSMTLALPLYAGWLVLSSVSDRVGDRCRLGLRVVPLPSQHWLPWRSGVPWLVHNLGLYGWSDPLALNSGALGSDEAVAAAMGEARPRLSLTGPSGLGSFAYLLFASFWGVFGWMEMFFSQRIQGLFLLLSLVPAIGILALLIDRFRSQRDELPTTRHVLWLAFAGVTFLAALLAYSLFDFQPQGRYLLTASVAIGLLYGAGLERLFRRWTPAWLILSSLALVAVNIYGALWVVPWYLAR